MTKKQKKNLIRIIISLVLFIALIVFRRTGVLPEPDGTLKGLLPVLLLAVCAYLIAGYDVVIEAAEHLVKGQLFDEDFLMMVATFGAFAIGEYTEAVAVMIFFQIGELFQSVAVGKSRASIKALMDIAPDFANVLKDGEIEETDPEDVQVGDVIVIRPGEKVPLDGIVLEGESLLDTSSLTGEPVPRSVRAGETVISGCVNGSGTLKAEVTKVYEDSTVSRILTLVEEASERKAPVENFITRFARVYTPVVTIAAVLLALIPPIIFHQTFAEWIRRACTFLVISCPCALVISVPLGFFGGIGAASAEGVLVKGSGFLETLASVKTLVLDKTGTLTKGVFEVQKILPAEGISEEALLSEAALMESYSTHPIADALKKAAEQRKADQGGSEQKTVSDYREISGQGIQARIGGQTVLAGNRKLLNASGIECPEFDEAGTVVYLASVSDGGNGQYHGAILISDMLKEGAAAALSDMRKAGVEKIVMLTGDRESAAAEFGKQAGVDEIHAELLPEDKVGMMEKLLADRKKGKTAFAGDGINDAPVLMRADLGIAMGALGSDAAIEAADIVLMNDDLGKIPETVRIARKTLRIVRENIVFALAVKFAVLILGALGFASMWLAVFADVGVAVIAILNSMRMLIRKKKK